MGLFTKEKELCPLCGKAFNKIVNAKFQLNDGNAICTSCRLTLGVITKQDEETYKAISFTEIKKAYDKLQTKKTIRDEKLSIFAPTAKYGNSFSYIWFDETNNIIQLKTSLASPELRFHYSEINSFTGEEDEKNIVKSGLGKAIAGGIIAGPAGMVAGAVIGKGQKGKDLVTRLSVTLQAINGNDYTILLINSKTKTNSQLYSNAKKQFGEILEKLAAIHVKSESHLDDRDEMLHSSADEIRKYKELLDDGIISAQEFETKKASLLK